MFHEIVGSVLSLVLICIGAFAMKSVMFIAWSYVIVMIVGTGIFIFFVAKYYGYRLNEILSDYMPFLLLSVLMGLIIYAIGRLNINRFILLILQIVSGVAIYIACSKVLKIKELDMCMAMVKKVMNKFRRQKTA